MYMESNVKPYLVVGYALSGIRRYDVNFDVVAIPDGYEYEQITLLVSQWNYAGIVDALIQHKYPIDKMQAVINNYLLDPNDVFAVEEFNKMQAWRKEAKEIAKEALMYELH